MRNCVGAQGIAFGPDQSSLWLEGYRLRLWMCSGACSGSCSKLFDLWQFGAAELAGLHPGTPGSEEVRTV